MSSIFSSVSESKGTTWPSLQYKTATSSFWTSENEKEYILSIELPSGISTDEIEAMVVGNTLRVTIAKPEVITAE